MSIALSHEWKEELNLVVPGKVYPLDRCVSTSWTNVATVNIACWCMMSKKNLNGIVAVVFSNRWKGTG